MKTISQKDIERIKAGRGVVRAVNSGASKTDNGSEKILAVQTVAAEIMYNFKQESHADSADIKKAIEFGFSKASGNKEKNGKRGFTMTVNRDGRGLITTIDVTEK